VRAAAARFDAARGALRVARASRRADVDVSLGFDHWPTSPTNQQGTGDSFSVGVSIPLRLFDTGEGVVGHARADVDAAQADLERARAAAQTEIRIAQEVLARATALAERYRTTLLPEAAAVLEAEEFAFRRGGASLLDLLDARRNARAVAVAAVAARRDAAIAAGRFSLAAGRDPLDAFLEGSSP
jgi:cobalt-zinc-cadmium efflux system outer membrane protein